MNYVEKFDFGLLAGLGSFSGAGEAVSIDVHPRSNALGHGGPDTIVVPDAQLLFAGDYKRSGLDLVLSKDGQEFMARDYFRGENRATLASPDGANLTGKTVSALAGQVDYAQAGGNIVPAKVIGQVTKLTGNATAIRNGVSISLNIGDNVHKGDVVQSGSDSSLGITFIDGTVFGLSSNARMVLNEMIYNPAGSNNASLLTLVQGTISFVAGATAKNGDMKVETPTATMGIRGTAVLVEIDFDIPQPGVAPPVSFRILVEPNGTSGEYVLLDKLTLQPIATVNQPGSQTIVNGQGVVTFIASAQIPANAQQLINEIFSLKFTDANPKLIGIPPVDTITPQTFLVKLPDGTPIDQLPIIRIALVFEAPAAPPPSGGNHRFHLNIPPDLVASSNYFTERFLTTGNTALDTVSGTIRFADINPEDSPTVTAQFNSFAYRNAQQDIVVSSSLTLEQLAAIKAVQVPLSVVADPGNTNIGEARWTYSVPDHALDFLAAGETLTLTYMARVDTNYSEYNTAVFKPFTVTITGTNDLPTAAATGSTVIELIGTGNPTIDHAEGVITFADVDLTDRPTVTAPFANYVYTAANGSPLTLTPAQQATLAATLTLTPAASNTNNGSVAWSYDVADTNFDFIATGETLVLTYTAIINDHHGGVVSVPLTLTVSVHGTNDIPTITASSDGFVELVGMTGNTAPDHAGGTITFADVDLTDRPTVSSHFTSFTYQNAAHTDVTSTLAALQLTAIDAVHPSLLLTPAGINANNGSVTWSYDLPDNSFDFLAAGEILTLLYTAEVTDHHGGTVSTPLTVTITGSNDAPDIVADTSGTSGTNVHDLTETDSALTTSGSLAVSDADVTNTVAASVHAFSVGGSGNASRPLALTDAMLQAMLSVDLGNVIDNASTDGTIHWNFDSALQAFDFLAAGETLELTYTIRATDSDLSHATADQTVVVTITGTNDAPVITADTSGTSGTNVHDLTEANAALTTSGSLAVSDADVTNTVAASVHAFSVGGSGNASRPLALTDAMLQAMLSVDLGNVIDMASTNGTIHWNFNSALQAFDFLADGETLELTYTIRATDSDLSHATADQTVVVTITGTNDAPVIIADTSGTSGTNVHDLIESNTALTASGSLAVSDADVTNTVAASVIAVGVDGTGLASVPSGLDNIALLAMLGVDTSDVINNVSTGGAIHWNFNSSPQAFDFLADGETLELTYTIRATDSDLSHATADQTVVIKITGTNDAPVVAAALTDSADEGDTAFTTDLLSGASDVDHGETATLSVASLLYAIDGGAASATLPAGISLGLDGRTLTIDAADPAFHYLAFGEQTVITVSYNVTDAQGATVPQTETITITGTNDAPLVAAALTDSADEGDTAFTTDLLSGASDVDHGETATLSVASLLYAIDGGAASATLPAGISLGLDGRTLTIDAADPAFDYLAFGEQTVITVSYDVTDAQGATVPQTETITISGTNDDPIVDAIAQEDLYVPASPGTLTRAIPVTFTDVDQSDVHTTQVTDVEATGETGGLTLNHAALIALMQASTVLEPSGSSPGSLHYDFIADSSDFNYLGGSDILTLTYTLEIDDLHGGVMPQTAVVAIHGNSGFFGV